MTLVLLTWFLIAPSLPGADADARLVAGRLRPRVARMLAAPALVAVLLVLNVKLWKLLATDATCQSPL